jgi:hypothetical protein
MNNLFTSLEMELGIWFGVTSRTLVIRLHIKAHSSTMRGSKLPHMLKKKAGQKKDNSQFTTFPSELGIGSASRYGGPW